MFQTRYRSGKDFPKVLGNIGSSKTDTATTDTPDVFATGRSRSDAALTAAFLQTANKLFGRCMWVRRAAEAVSGS
jgi:hypothetical protein